MDYIAYRRMMKIADHVDTEYFQVPAGAIMRTLVTLDRVMSTDMDDEPTVEWVVTDQAANPPRYLLHTTDPAAAHRAYADAIDAARVAQAERVMSRR